MKILTEAFVAVFLCTCVLSLDFKAEYIQLSLSKSLVIKSPGYPNISYAKGITYRWHVNSFGITEKIFIKIKMDLFEGPGSQCGDYLQIQEINALATKSTIFDECGKKETNIKSKEHRLLIKFVSNNDSFTSKGFEVILRGNSSMKEIRNYTHLPSYEDVIIQSPGYPNKNYSRDTTYKWLVTAPYTTEEILIKIKMDIHKSPHSICEDYLQIEEANSFTGNFQVFKQCGILETGRTARGHRLLIKLVSNDDVLTSKGFELKLKVIKVRSPTYVSSPTTVESISSETSLSAPLTKMSTIMLSTSPDTHTERSKTFLRSKAAKDRTSADLSSLTSPSTTKSTTILSPIETTIRIVKSTSHVSTTDANIEGPRATTDFSTSLDKFSVTQTTTDRKETTLPSQNIASSSPTSNVFLEYKTVFVLVGLGVVELTLIIVGTLAVVKHRRRRIYNTASKQTDWNNGRLHMRQNNYKSTNVYDVIELGSNNETIEDCNNPYKELPEGEYDKIFQPRPHVNNGEVQDSIYSKGAIVLTMFRRSSFSKGKANETPPAITFSTFKGSEDC